MGQLKGAWARESHKEREWDRIIFKRHAGTIYSDFSSS
jgi:hypothetical protein